MNLAILHLRWVRCATAAALLLLGTHWAAAQGQDFDFGDGRHGSYIIPPGTITIQQLWSDITGNAQGAYDPANDNQVLQFENLTISNGATLTVDAFSGNPDLPVDPKEGGVIRIKVRGTLSIAAAGRIDASGKGYSGGRESQMVAFGAGQQGDSWGNGGENSTTANRGGGGGGAGEASLGNRQPQSGAGGGHAGAGNAGDTALSGNAQGGASFDEVAASLGTAFNNQYPFPRFGSGGGRGGYADNFANALALGGNGGGVIIIEAELILNSGAIRADGAAGGSGLSGGGGGAGGSVLVRTLSNLNGVVTVNGGSGGSGSWNANSRGGAGSAGIRVWEQRYLIEREVLGNGSIVLTPNQEQYGEGEIVSVLAVPDPGWRFVRWEEDLTTSANPAELEIDGPKLIRAVFEEPPVISLLPIAPQVGAQAQQITFQVANVGGGVLAWIASIQDDPEGFITITSQTPNQTAAGNGRFVISVAENRSLASRQAVLVVEGSDPDTPPVLATITQLAAVPQLRVSPALTNVAGGVSAATIAVQNIGTGDMPWTANFLSGNDFATITAGTSGTGNGSISVAVTANPTAASRTAILEIVAPGAQGSPQQVSIVQAPGEPILQITPQTQVVDAEADTINFVVTNAGNGAMDWASTIVTGGDFLSIVSGESGVNAGLISVSVAENTTTANRSGTIRVDSVEADNAPVLLTITQKARDRVLVLSTNSLTVGATGGSIGFGIQNAGIGSMTWNATVRSGSEFITIAPGTATGTNTGVVTLIITENPRNEPRNGSVEVSAPGAFNSPQTVAITQTAQNIVLSVTPQEIDIGPAGGNTTFTVQNTGTGTMLWTAAIQSGADFVTVNSGASGTNTGVVGLTVKENSTGLSRTATVLVNAPEAGNNPVTVTLRQAPSDNLLQVSPQTIDIGSNGGPISFTVQNAGTGSMKWTAVVQTGADFLTVTGGSGSGTNTGLVSLLVAENENDVTRTGTVLVTAPEANNSPVVVTINQARREAVLEVSPTDLNLGAAGGIATFTVQNGGTGTMNWTASVQTGGDFASIAINPATGQSSGVGINSGTVRVQLTENTSNDVRVATVLVGALGAANSPVTVTITQAPRNAVLEVNPQDLSVGSDGGPLSFAIQNSGTGTMTWSAAVQTGAEFVSITGGSGTGSNTGNVTFTVAANTTGLPRTGAILVSAPGATNSPLQVSITQSGGNNVLQVVPTALSIGASGGDTNFTVKNAGTGSMNWNASVQSGVEFIQLIAGTATGLNTGTVGVRILENNTDAPRTGTILVEAPGADNSPVTVTVTQSPRAAVLLVNPETLNADPAGGPLNFTVENTGTGSMNWAASVQSGADFVRITPIGGVSSGFGTNTGTVALQVDENTTDANRVATIQVQAVGASNSPATVTITQSRRNVVLQVTPATRVIGAGAGEVQFDVHNAGTGTMNFSASVQDGADFLSIATNPGTGQSTGSGVNDGTIRLTVAANRSGATRIGTLRIDAPGAAGSPALVTVTQLAQDLSLQVTPQQQNVGSDGGSVGFTIENLGTGTMTWTTTIDEGSAFVTLGAGSATGTGDGAVSVTVAPNGTGEPRSAILRITAPGAANSPTLVTLNQAATAAVLRINPEEQSIGSRAGNVVFQVANAGTGNMPWVASVASGANFITLSDPTSGIDKGAITVAVSANTSAADREATIRVEAPGAAGSPATLRILQRSGDTELRLTPLSQNIGSVGGIIDFQVQNAGAGELRWTTSLIEGANFARITSPLSGIDEAIIQVTVDPNTDITPRTVRMRVEAAGAANSPTTVTIVQALCEVPRKPIGLSASDGGLVNAIELRWSAVTGVERYEIYRGDTSDPFASALIGTTEADVRIYTDTTAQASTARRMGGGCFAPAQFEFIPRRYYYWVAGVNQCGPGVRSEGDAGYRAVQLSTGQILSAEKALPPAEAGGLARLASPEDTLYVRVHSEAGIVAGSFWADVRAGGEGADDPIWIPGVDENDGWVAVAPRSTWLPGDVVSVTAGAEDGQGGAIVSEAIAFEIIAGTPKARLAVDPPASVAEPFSPVTVVAVESGLVSLAASVGTPYLVGPAAPFDTPQTVWLPIPAGAENDTLVLNAYLGDPDHGGWRPAEEVEGLLDDSGLRLVEANGTWWVGAVLRHGAVLQWATTPAAQTSDARMLPWPPETTSQAGGLLIWALTGILLWAFATRWKRGISQA